MNTFGRRAFLKGSALIGVGGLLASCGAPAQGSTGQMVWVTFSAGTGTYNDIAAIANLITNESGTRVRLMTGDTGIARVAPLISRVADYARAGDETYYAFEGDDEYASETWGPQPVRGVWNPPGNYGVFTLQKSGIETVSDLRGKRYPRLIASTSINRKLEAILNFGGLTRDDVELVDIAYSEQIAAVRAGHLDAAYHNVVGATIEELNTTDPIHWLNLGGGAPEQYATWEELAPMVIPGTTLDAVGHKGEPITNMQYSIPLSTLADRPAEEVYSVLKVMHDNFDTLSGMTPDIKNFATDRVHVVPMVIPFHDGAIRFLREQGRWNDSLQQRHEALLEREALMKEAWPGFWRDNYKDFPERQGPNSLAAAWRAWKKDNLPALPQASDPTAAA